MRRSQTNTPLQALVTLNDPVYIEAAQALARRSLKESSSEEPSPVGERMFRLALIRPPKPVEIKPLTDLYEQAYRSFLLDVTAAKSLANEPRGASPEGTDVVSLAAWTAVANVVLHLDETFQKP